MITDMFHVDAAFPVEAMQQIVEIKDLSERAMAYNHLGMHAMDAGDFGFAMENFLIAKNTLPDSAPALVAFSNIGKLYDVLGRPDIGLTYTKKVEDLFEAHPEWDDLVGRINNLCLTTSLEIKTGQFESAQERMKLIDRLHPEDDEHSNILMTKIQIYHALGAEEQEAACNREYFEKLPQLLKIDIHIQQASEMSIFYLSKNRLAQARKVLDIMRPVVEHSGNIGYKTQYINNLIQYDTATGNQTKRYTHIEMFYQLMQTQISESYKNMFKGVRFRETADQVKMRQQRLEQEARTDVLTGLPNRKALKENMAAGFSHASREHLNFAFGLLDIDYFKQLNDFYGHQKGDEALQVLGEVIREATERAHTKTGKDVFAGRYGGDEFSLFMIDMTEKEIYAFCTDLQRRLAERKLPHEKSAVSPYMTVSIGVYSAVPAETDKLSDFVYAADSLLYEVKRERKGTYALRTN